MTSLSFGSLFATVGCGSATGNEGRDPVIDPVPDVDDVTPEFTQMSFEGLEVEAYRGNIQASVIPMLEPLKPHTAVRLTVLARVHEVRFGGEPPARTHIIKPLEVEKLEVL